jgi:hypothetical protein
MRKVNTLGPGDVGFHTTRIASRVPANTSDAKVTSEECQPPAPENLLHHIDRPATGYVQQSIDIEGADLGRSSLFYRICLHARTPPDQSLAAAGAVKKAAKANACVIATDLARRAHEAVSRRHDNQAA